MFIIAEPASSISSGRYLATHDASLSNFSRNGIEFHKPFVGLMESCECEFRLIEGLLIRSCQDSRINQRSGGPNTDRAETRKPP